NPFRPAGAVRALAQGEQPEEVLPARIIQRVNGQAVFQVLARFRNMVQTKMGPPDFAQGPGTGGVEGQGAVQVDEGTPAVAQVVQQPALFFQRRQVVGMLPQQPVQVPSAFGVCRGLDDGSKGAVG